MKTATSILLLFFLGLVAIALAADSLPDNQIVAAKEFMDKICTLYKTKHPYCSGFLDLFCKQACALVESANSMPKPSASASSSSSSSSSLTLGFDEDEEEDFEDYDEDYDIGTVLADERDDYWQNTGFPDSPNDAAFDNSNYHKLSVKAKSFASMNDVSSFQKSLKSRDSTTKLATLSGSNVNDWVIKAWSGQITFLSTPFFKYINTAIYSDNEAQLTLLMPFIATLNKYLEGDATAACNGAKTGSTTVYRGFSLTADRLNVYKSLVGKFFKTPTYLATSTDKTISTNFASKASGGKKGVLFTIRLPCGYNHVRPISSMSVFPNEKEVLFKPYSAFKVESVSISKSGISDVTLSALPYYRSYVTQTKTLEYETYSIGIEEFL